MSDTVKQVEKAVEPKVTEEKGVTEIVEPVEMLENTVTGAKETEAPVEAPQNAPDAKVTITTTPSTPKQKSVATGLHSGSTETIIESFFRAEDARRKRVQSITTLAKPILDRIADVCDKTSAIIVPANELNDATVQLLRNLGYSVTRDMKFNEQVNCYIQGDYIISEW